MTLSSEKIKEAVARALVERDGWDFDNLPKSARAPYLGAAEDALLAVLPMVAEEIRRAADAALADDEWCRAAFSSLIEGMKAPTEKVEG